ncbi:MAG: hypothetical protein BECKG1743F_GA0114225_107922 [Candidatus Kentron sp. G]|nr:MAG: hypothetical protein BECKG1743F_GA0114225_107922 [Candidatus Kentron sp. G]
MFLLGLGACLKISGRSEAPFVTRLARLRPTRRARPKIGLSHHGFSLCPGIPGRAPSPLLLFLVRVGVYTAWRAATKFKNIEQNSHYSAAVTNPKAGLFSRMIPLVSGGEKIPGLPRQPPNRAWQRCERSKVCHDWASCSSLHSPDFGPCAPCQSRSASLVTKSLITNRVSPRLEVTSH